MDSDAKFSNDMREIPFQQGYLKQENIFTTNYIHTTRYTRYNLLPKNLFEQFHRSANIWFLVVSIFQLLPLGLSTTSNWETIAPLAFLLTFSLVKDAFGDYRRHKSDQKLNKKESLIWQGNGFLEMMNASIQVGHIVLLKNGQTAPTDMILIAAGNQQKNCYVDNQNIIGETKLSKKTWVKCTSQQINSQQLDAASDQIVKLSGKVLVDFPNGNLNNFNGSIQLKGMPRKEEITRDSLILRGAVIKGTRWIFGFTIYTGIDTKMQQNIKKPKHKTSRIEKQVNVMVPIMLAILVGLVVISLILNETSTISDDVYVPPLNSFILFVLLYNSIVPISLFVIMDLVKVLQMIFIQKDEDMRSPETGKRCVANIGDINEDLGQVEYIFADKTQTLTKNMLSMKACFIGKTFYGSLIEEKELKSFSAANATEQMHEASQMISIPTKDAEEYTDRRKIAFEDDDLHTNSLRRNGSSHRKVAFTDEMRTDMRTDRTSLSSPGCFEEIPDFKKCDASLYRDLRENTDHSEVIKKFWECLALCNSVIPKQEENDNIEYLSSSPDEEALVKAARSLGFSFVERGAHIWVVNVFGSSTDYNVVGLRHFSSDNQSSSCVIELENGDGMLFVKGSLKSMLGKVKEEHTEMMCNQFKEVSVSLRTMVLAHKILPHDQLQDFLQKFNNAKATLINIEKKQENVFKEFETELDLLGVVGVEDSLDQETITMVKEFRRAGIKLWIVSGDTDTSCISAARTGRLLRNEDAIVDLWGLTDTKSCQSRLIGAIRKNLYQEHTVTDANDSATERASAMDFGGSIDERASGRKNTNRSSINKFIQSADVGTKIQAAQHLRGPIQTSDLAYGVSINGESLQQILYDLELRKLLVVLLFCAKTVIASRMSPMQKAQLVQLVRTNFSFKPVTLAVGASDSNMPMIQAADIGVGIKGMDRTQLSISSEYAIQSFKDLRYLVLKHGRYNYLRVSQTVLLFLYKNALIVFLLFLFIFLSDYSGANLFNAGLLLFYNMAFTTLPIVVLGTMDHDMPIKKVLNHPETYIQGIMGQHFSLKILLKFIVIAWIHAFSLVLLVFMSFYRTVMTEDGQTEDLTTIGTVMFVATVLTVLFQIFVQAKSLNIMFISSFILIVAVLFVYITFLSFVEFPDTTMLGVIISIFSQPVAIIAIFLPPIFNFAISYTFEAFWVVFQPSITTLITMGKQIYLPDSINRRLDNYKENILDVFSEGGKFQTKQEKDESFSFNRKTLKFDSAHLERQYMSDHIQQHIKISRFCIGILTILLLLWTAIETAITSPALEYTIVRVISSVVFVLCLLYTLTNSYKRNYQKMTLLGILAILIVKFAIEAGFAREGGLSAAITPIVTFVFFNVGFIETVLVNMFHIVLFLITMSLFVFSSSDEDYSGSEGTVIVISYFTLIVGITLTWALIGYWLEKAEREEFVLMRQIVGKMDKFDTILSLIFPKFVKKRVKYDLNQMKFIADEQRSVTVIFCDIANFDDMCVGYSPQELTDFLDNLFQIFDHLCDSNGVVKIETVGKTYMACGGLSEYEENLTPEFRRMSHARRSLEFALDVLRAISSIKVKTQEGDAHLLLKIGIHSGPVIAGVVGSHKPQFSLIGSTVNHASRMGSTLKTPNCIQISQECFDLVGELPHIQYEKGTVWAKGLGDVNCYTLTEKITSGDVNLNTEECEEDENLNSQRTVGPTDIERRATMAAEKVSRGKTRSESLIERLNMERQLTRDQIGKVSVKLCKCEPETKAQRKFRLSWIESHAIVFSWGFYFAIGVLVILFAMALWMYVGISAYSSILVLIGRICALGIVVAIIFVGPFFMEMKIFPAGMAFLLVAISILACLVVVDASDFPFDVLTIEMMYYILLLNHAAGVFFRFSLQASLLITIPWIILSLAYSIDNFSVIGNALFIGVFVIINLYTTYTKEKHQRQLSDLNSMAKTEIEKSSTLLNQLMPPHVLKNMLEDKALTDKLNEVPLLFADIVGFTAYSANKKPIQVVEMLSELFKRFDQLWLEFDVYKVHTIGDCYVVMGYRSVEGEERNIAQELINTVEFGFKCAEAIQQYNKDNNIPENLHLNFRIGIHIGEVIAGITGTNIVRYDIYGPDVLIANKMESGGEAGKVNVSDVTRTMIEKTQPDAYTYTENQLITAKAVNREHMSYFMSKT